MVGSWLGGGKDADGRLQTLHLLHPANSSHVWPFPVMEQHSLAFYSLSAEVFLAELCRSADSESTSSMVGPGVGETRGFCSEFTGRKRKSTEETSRVGGG